VESLLDQPVPRRSPMHMRGRAVDDDAVSFSELECTTSRRQRSPKGSRPRHGRGTVSG